MSNEPQKKNFHFLLPSTWKLSRSRPPSPNNAGPSASPKAPSLLKSRSFSPSIIQSSASTAQAGSSKSKCDQPSSYPVKECAKTTLKGVYELVKVLNESSGIFAPLKSATGGFVACVEVYKNTSGNHEEMKRILKNFDQLASALATKLEEIKDHKSLVQIIKNLAESLEKEDRMIKAMHDRGILARLAHNSEDTGQLVSSCQAMKDAFDTFNFGITLLVERNTHDILKHVVFQTLRRSHDAAFSAAIDLDNVSRGPCTKDTRVDVIKQIMEWAETDPASAKAPSVYWLNGLAGLGKTTIAYTICERLEEARIPFTSYFCSRQLDSKNSKLLVTTLCRDLAELFSSYASKVLPVLQNNSKIVDEKLHLQMDKLLAKPWKDSLARRDGLPLPVVVVDALDESDCGTEFLKELLRAVDSGKLVGIRFLVTSRPERSLVDMYESFPANVVCKLHELDPSNVQKDIEKYLCEALPELKDGPELVELASRAGGFFIFAATAVRFLSPPRPFSPFTPDEKRSRLQSMLSLWPTSSGSFGRLAVDVLYENVLGVAFWDDSFRHKRLQILHTVLCAVTKINMSVIADLNNTSQDTVKTVVDSLYAVLFVSSKDGCVYWYHASLLDFIFTQGRAKFRISPQPNCQTQEINVFCDESAHHTVLASRCFSIMNELLHFNMCDLDSSYIFDSDVPNFSDRTHTKLRPTIRYASRYWAKHLSRAAPAESGANGLLILLNEFMRDKLLFWIEAMNLIDARIECAPLLKDTEDWLKRGKGIQQRDLLEYLTDAAMFSTFFSGSHASKSTPHLYVSALPTWYQHSPVWTHWKHRFSSTPLITLLMGTITVPLLTILKNDRIRCMALSKNGEQIVTGSPDDSVRVWDAMTGELQSELQGYTLNVESVAFSPDGKQIASGSYDKSVRVWDAKTGNQLKELQGHTNYVISVAFSPNGNQIASGSYDKSVRVWDVKTGDQLKELQGHTNYVISVAFSPDGKQIASGSNDKSLRVWDVETGNQLRELQGHNSVSSVMFSPEGNQILSGSLDHSLRVWYANSGNELRELQGHINDVISVAFSPDGNEIVSGSEDQSIRAWDAKTGNQLRELQGHTSDVTSVTFSPDGNQIASGSYDGSVRVWDAKAGNQPMKLRGHTGFVISVAFSPDGKQIASGSYDKSLRVWDVETGNQLSELQGHTNYVISVAFSPDGKQIASGSNDKSLRVWVAKTGNQLRELQGHTSDVNSVAFSPDGNQIASGSSDKTVLVWDAETGNQLRKLQRHTSDVKSVVFSPDSNQIASGSSDKTVLVWDTKTGNQLRELQGHSSVVTSVAFSPDGNQIISGSKDQSVRVWDAKTGERLRKMQGHNSQINLTASSPDDNQITSCSTDQLTHMWAHLDLDNSWVMHEDGWILSAAKRLVWIPPTIRNVLYYPYCILIISQRGSAKVSFKNSKLGPLWRECYTP